ncbi:MAG: hypothetical protein ACLGJA_24760, partial [Gammaproteobacteria bacterium]
HPAQWHPRFYPPAAKERVGAAPARLQIAQNTHASFIPEVWQGHKDHGAGFWSALRFLESL